jgi:hypothetical protein
MNAFIQFLLRFVFSVCPLAALLFIVRLVVSTFSVKVSAQIRRHPVIHTIWGCFAFVGFLSQNAAKNQKDRFPQGSQRGATYFMEMLWQFALQTPEPQVCGQSYGARWQSRSERERHRFGWGRSTPF